MTGTQRYRSIEMKIARWIVVANAAQARLLAHDVATDSLVLLHRMLHRASRAPGRPLESPREFAREIAEYVDDAHAHAEFDTLCIAAPSPFLGELERELSGAVHQTLGATVDTDLTTLDLRQLLHRLRALHADA
ncbi:MAG TPA: host attachment protein [Albitalea sp.]